MQITIMVLAGILLLVPLLFLLYERPEGQNRYGDAASPVSFTDAIRLFFLRYFDFSGRSSRSEFWYAIAFFAAVCFLIGLTDAPDLLFSIWSLGTLVPLLSVSARRLHDTNRNGWLQIASWFSPIGTIIAIVWLCEPPRE
jgi:uncharacterized membrane protein YhaH (DUF805 family)